MKHNAIPLLVLSLILLNINVLFASNPAQVKQFINHKDWNFTENKGQLADENGNLLPDIKYYGHQDGVNLYCKPGMLSFVFTKIEKAPEEVSEATGTAPAETGHALSLRGRHPKTEPSTITACRADMLLVGANLDAQIIASEQQEYYENFYLAHTGEAGITNVQTYKTVTYKNIYPHIDMVLHAKPEGMKYEFAVYPGGKVSDIKIQWNGLQNMQMAENGGISYSLALGKMDEGKPVSFQEGKTIKSSFTRDGNRIGFKVRKFDGGKVMVIDPSLVWGTYFGGSSSEIGAGICSDKSGNICLAGYTLSSSSVASTGAYQTSYGTNTDVFIAKFNSSGGRIWSTYYGGTGSDYGQGAAIDSIGNIFITGYTSSTGSIASSGAYKTSFSGNFDAFISKFSASGTRTWATYYGGTNYDRGTAITIDTAQNVYISGYTASTAGISTSGAYQTSNNGGTYDGFLSKFSNSGSIIWGTYFGGTAIDMVNCIKADKIGYLYICGLTQSTSNIATSGAYLTSLNTTKEAAFITKLTYGGSIIWGTYFGGNEDYASALALDTGNNIFITGATSGGAISLATSGAYKTSYTGASGYVDSYLAKFNNSGILQWSTYFGGSDDDQGLSLACDPYGYVYITGYTRSSTGIATSGAYQTSKYGSGAVGFIGKFRNSGGIVASTYLQGSGSSISLQGNAIISDGSGNIFLTGSTTSTSGLATSGTYQTSVNATDAFLVKFKIDDFANNAGIPGIVSPSSKICTGKQSVKVDLRNFGYKELDSVQVHVSITNYSPYTFTWKGILKSNSDTILNLGDFTFATGSDTILCWTSLPNGVKDSGSSNDSAIAILTVNAMPVANAGGNKAVCKDLSAVVGTSPTSGHSYSWTSSPSLFSSTTANPSFTFSANVKLFLKETITASGCTSYDTAIITVNPRATPNFNPYPLSTCFVNNAFRMDDNSTIKSGSISSWAWSFGDGKTSNTQAVTHSYASTGSYTIKLVVTTDKGCKDSINEFATVYPNPTASFTIDKISQCLSGNSFAFTDKSTVKSGSVNFWQWEFGDSSTYIHYNPSYSYKKAGIYVVKLKIHTDHFCYDSTTATVSITSPTAAFAINSANKCLTNNSFSFSDSSKVSSSSITSWLWSFGDTKTSTSQNPSHSYTSAGTYTVKLVVTSSSGCKDSTTKIVTVYSLPVPSFNIASSAQCLSNNAFSFTDKSTISSGSITAWAWDFGDNKTSSSQNPSYSYGSAGTYTVKLVVTSNNGCKDSVTKSVTVYPQTTPSFTVNTSMQCLPSNSFSFTDHSTISSGSISSWSWNFNDTKTSLSQSPTHSFAASGSYKVILTTTTNNGCTDTLSKQITVYSQPSSSFTINTNAQCLTANSYSFTDGSTIGSGSIASWSWNFGDNGTSTSQSSTHSYSLAGIYPVKLVITSNNGCKDSISKNVTVYPQASPGFTVKSNKQCLSGNSFSFTDNTTISSGSISKWAWDFGDSKTSSSQNPSHSYISAGIFKVILTVTSNNGCTDTVSKQITVYPQPSPLFSINTSAQCLTGNSFTFTDGSSISSGSIASWAWNFGDNGTSTLQSPSHNYSSAGTYTVKLVITSDNGCKDSTTKTVTVYPQASIGFTVNNNAQCFAGNSFSFTDKTTISSGSISAWAWNFGDSKTSASQNPNNSYASAGRYQILLKTTSNYGCTDTISHYVNVYPQPSAAFSVNNATQCLTGNSFSFTDGSTLTSGVISAWHWDFGDNSSSSLQNSTHSFALSGTYTVKLVITTASGCKDSVSKTVTVNPMPAAQAGNGKAICLGSNTTIGAASVAGNTYSWGSNPSGFTSTLSNPNVNPSVNTTYYLTETITATGCQKTDSVKITVNPLPDAVTGAARPICFNSSTTLGSSSISGHTYSWSSSPAGFSSALSNPVVSPVVNTTYYLTETISATGCSKSDSVKVSVNSLPAAKVAANKTICPGNGVDLGSASVSGSTYAWISKPSGFTSTLSNPSVKPSASTTYYLTETITATGCSKIDSVKISIDPSCKGYLTIEMDSAINTFDTLHVKIHINSASNIYAVYARLEMKPDVFKLVSSSPGTFLGSNIINTPAIQNNGYLDFGMTKKGTQPGSNGNGLFYNFTLVVKDSFPTTDVTSLFTLDSIIAYDNGGNPVNVYDSAGKTVHVHSRVYVWPGDLNNDRHVDVADILPIGYFYNTSGPKRTSASLSWTAQPAPFWGYDKSTHSKKGWAVFADADGNGIVGLADQAAIGLNLGKSHSKTSSYKPPVLPPYKSGDPDLTAAMADTLILQKDLPKKITIPVKIGSSAVPVKNLNGVAFNLYFDPQYVDASSVTIDYSGSVFGAENSDFIQVEDVDLSNGRLSIGMTRYNNATINGYGTAATISFSIPASAPKGYLKMYAILIQATDSNGKNISINSTADSLRIGDKTGIASMETNLETVNIYPNPFHASTTLSYSLKNSSKVQIVLMDVSGRQLGTVVNANQPAGEYKQEISAEKYHLTPGVYLVKMMVDEEIVSKNIVKLE